MRPCRRREQDGATETRAQTQEDDGVVPPRRARGHSSQGVTERSQVPLRGSSTSLGTAGTPSQTDSSHSRATLSAVPATGLRVLVTRTRDQNKHILKGHNSHLPLWWPPGPERGGQGGAAAASRWPCSAHADALLLGSGLALPGGARASPHRGAHSGPVEEPDLHLTDGPQRGDAVPLSAVAFRVFIFTFFLTLANEHPGTILEAEEHADK